MKPKIWLTIVLGPVVLGLGLAARAVADEPKGDFQVHDLSLWILDSTASLANSRNVYPSAFPPTVQSARSVSSSREARRTAPMGLITFYGRPATSLDVDLRIKSGSFLAHWPVAESLPNRLRWSGGPGVELVEKLEDESELVFVDDEHWFRKARDAQTLYVRRGARAERFLTYDAELNLSAPIRLHGGPDKYTVVNVSGATLYDVLISRSTPEGRRVAWIDVLPKPETAKPNTAKPGSPAKPVDLFGDGGPKPAQPAKGELPAIGLFGVPAKAKSPDSKDAVPKDAVPKDARPKEAKPQPAKRELPAIGLFGVPAKAKNAESKDAAPKDAAPAPDKPQEKSQDKPQEVPGAALAAQLAAKGLLPKAQAEAAIAAAKAGGKGAAAVAPVAGVEVTLSDPLPVGSTAALASTAGSLSERLARTGLAKEEIELFVANYATLLFEGEAVVVACRLDGSAIDDKMPLSIFPEPTKMIRVPIVIMRNADPQLGGEVDRLVLQLGDPKYTVRDAAQQRLIELGPLAFPALNKALNHADMEVVVRAERVLLNQNQPALGRQGTAPAGAAAAPPNAVLNKK